MDYPKVSVAIPVRALGSGDIVLNSLKKADYPKELIETFVIEGDNPSYQRNEAIKKASGDIIFFFDDDSEIDPQLFKETIATYQKHPEVIGVGGPACLYGNTYFQQANIIILTSLLGVYKIRSRYSPVGKLRYTNEDELISCNLNIKRNIFEKEDGFNEKLYPNEENELIHRLIKKGYKFIYNPNCKVYRRTDGSLGVFLRRIFSYGRGRVEQLFISPSGVSLLRSLPLIFLLYLFILPFIHKFYFSIPLFLYLTAVLFFSIYNSRHNLKIMPLVFILYLSTHIAYGYGEGWGILNVYKYYMRKYIYPLLNRLDRLLSVTKRIRLFRVKFGFLAGISFGMNRIVFIPTWRCNLKCSYCDYKIITKGQCNEGIILKAFDREIMLGAELDWFEWLKQLERFKPYFLEMTGGEPLMYKDLDKLLTHLPLSCKWAITSNTLDGGVIKKLPGWNCLSWTASYHFHSEGLFRENLFILHKKGINPRITIVLTPENHKLAFAKIKEFSECGYGVNIHPMLKQNFSWEKYMEIWKVAEELADGKRIIFIDDISYKWLPERHNFCKAGKDYFVLMPDGRILRCYSQILTDKDLGYVWDFKPNTVMCPCNIDCMFPCDRKVEKAEHN